LCQREIYEKGFLIISQNKKYNHLVNFNFVVIFSYFQNKKKVSIYFGFILLFFYLLLSFSLKKIKNMYQKEISFRFVLIRMFFYKIRCTWAVFFLSLSSWVVSLFSWAVPLWATPHFSHYQFLWGHSWIWRILSIHCSFSLYRAFPCNLYYGSATKTTHF